MAVDEEPSDHGLIFTNNVAWIPTNRTHLLLDFDMQRMHLEGSTPRYHDYFQPDYYPPSIRDLSDLESICLKDLKRDRRHDGCVIYLKNIETGIRSASIRTIVEDSNEAVERLCVYNIPFEFDAAELLYEGAILAIKEPFLQGQETGGYSIRVDHPTDLFILGPKDPRIPTKLVENHPDLQRSPSDWRTIGNDAANTNKWLSAVRAYTSGLDACGESDDEIRCLLLRNRSVAHRGLRLFEAAIDDALQACAVLKNDASIGGKVLTARAYLYAGLAAEQMFDFKKAKEYYDKSSEATPEVIPPELRSALARIPEKIRKKKRHMVPLDELAKNCSQKHNRLDQWSSYTDTEIKDSGPRGRGLFAKKDMKVGDIIMCEKALGVMFTSDPILDKMAMKGIGRIQGLHPKSQRKADYIQTGLLASLCHKISQNSDLAQEFFALYDGEQAGGPVYKTDGIIAVDIFRAFSIISHNSIACPTVGSYDFEARQDRLKEAKEQHSMGLWPRTSYINHSCTGNAMRSHLGDMIIIRAKTPIKKGEEILMPYLYPSPHNSATASALQSKWGFTCDCKLCMAERQSEHVHDSDIFQSAAGTIMNFRNEQDPRPNVMTRLYQKCLATYDDDLFKDLPRVILGPIQMELCHYYAETKAWSSVLSAAELYCRDTGFQIDYSRHASPPIKGEYIIMNDSTIAIISLVCWAWWCQNKDAEFKRAISALQVVMDVLLGVPFDPYIEMGRPLKAELVEQLIKIRGRPRPID